MISIPTLANEWHGFEVVSYIKLRFGLDAKLENDANVYPIAIQRIRIVHICIVG